MKRISLIIVLVALVNCYSQTGSFFSAENKLRFANSLYNEGDYIRAIEEFREVYKTIPDDTLLFKTARAYSSLNRYSEAEDIYRSLLGNNRLNTISTINIFADKLRERDIASFERLLNDRLVYPDTGYLQVNKMKHILEYEALLPDTSIYIDFTDSQLPALRNLYSLRQNAVTKSPATAAILSAVLPGSGKIYTGDYSDGITAFLANVLLAYLAYDNIKNERVYRAVIFSGLSAWFYAGNIYGSYASAQIFNARQQQTISVNVYSLLKKLNYFLPEL